LMILDGFERRFEGSSEYEPFLPMYIPEHVLKS
jgi:hypothetical protein